MKKSDVTLSSLHAIFSIRGIFYVLLFMRPFLCALFNYALWNALFGIHSLECALYYSLFTMRSYSFNYSLYIGFQPLYNIWWYTHWYIHTIYCIILPSHSPPFAGRELRFHQEKPRTGGQICYTSHAPFARSLVLKRNDRTIYR